MMCRLFGFVNTIKFKENWTPLIEAVSDGYILDWATIISYNLIRFITAYRENRNSPPNADSSFYVSSYILDTSPFFL